MVIDFEEQVKKAEENVIQNNLEENRARLHLINAQYIKYMKLETFILQQKTKLQWFKEGDTNSKYFHSMMRGRRRKLFIHRICTDEDTWIQGDENIAKKACMYYKIFSLGNQTESLRRFLIVFPGWLQMSRTNFFNKCLICRN